MLQRHNTRSLIDNFNSVIKNLKEIEIQRNESQDDKSESRQQELRMDYLNHMSFGNIENAQFEVRDNRSSRDHTIPNLFTPIQR